MTEQAQSAHNQPADDAVNPQNKAMNPDDRPMHLRARTAEIGGRQGPEPTRYGDWELRGRCIDF
jgi:hypothetical protein